MPYLPSLGWYRKYYEAMMVCGDEMESRRRAIMQSGMTSREETRTLVAGAYRQEMLQLTVPIEGGSKVVKRGKVGEWEISQHGRWQKMHLGAISAGYASTPYYAHYIDDIAKAIEGAAGNFAEFTERLHHIILEQGKIRETLGEMQKLREERPQFLERLNVERSRGSNEDESILGALFRHGPEIIFIL